MDAWGLKEGDIVKLAMREGVIVVGRVLGRYEGTLRFEKDGKGSAKATEGDNPYPGSIAVQLMESKSVVPVFESMLDVEWVVRAGVRVYGPGLAS